MSDSSRSIVARLKLDISDLRANARAAKAELGGIASSAKDTGAKGGAALAGIGSGIDRGLATVGKHEQSLTKLGGGLTKVGLAAAAGFGIAVKSAADFDQGMSNVAATGDDARQNISALRQEAINLGAATQFSATEAAGGIENLLKAGVSAQDTLGGGLKGALDLAAAGQISVADASEVAATALTQFKLSGKDVPHVADLLAAGAGKAQGEVSDMAGALQQSGLVASQFGLSLEDTTGTLSAFASAGLIGSDAGTSFKTMLLALANPSKESRALMDQLGISAYDAQGKFVGVSNLAEQLKTRLGGLTQAQRDQALAQIFGNDAVRAANVLYSEGGAGIDSWRGKVDDAGYAAETAATKTDNLYGDLERLKGALSSALIGGGSGSTSALREITQLVTRLVDGFNELDPTTQANAVRVLALVAALGLGGGAVLKLVTSLAAGRAALIAFGETARVQAAGGLGAFSGAAVGATAALVALGVATSALSDLGQQGQGQSVIVGQLNELAVAGDRASATALQVQGAFGETKWADRFAAVATGSLVAPVDNLSDALESLNAQKGSLTWLSGMKEQVLPGLQSFEKLTKGVTDTDQAFAAVAQQGNVEGAGKAFATAIKDANVSSQQLVDSFPQYKAVLEQTANDLHVAGLSADDFAGWMRGTVPASIAAAQAQKTVAESAKDLGPAFDTARDALEALQVPLEQGLDSKGLKQVSDALFAEGDAYQSAIEGRSSYKQAVEDASSALKGATGGIDDNTAAGRKNISTLGQLSSEGKDYVRGLVLQGASQKKISGALKDVRSDFIKSAEATGLNSKAAKKLADDYGLIPDEVSTTFDAIGLALQQQKVADYLAALKGLPEDVAARIRATYDSKGAKAAEDELNHLSGKTATPRIVTASDAKKIARQAAQVLDSIPDGKPRVRTGSDAKKVAGQAQRFLDSIKDVDPKVLTKAELTAAARAKALLDSINSKTVTVTTKQFIETHRSLSRESGRSATRRDGGPLVLPAYAFGGRIVGDGGPRQDNIALVDRETGVQTAWGSADEFVTNAASYSKSKDAVETINANPGQKFVAVPMLADGGVPGSYVQAPRSVAYTAGPAPSVGGSAAAVTIDYERLAEAVRRGAAEGSRDGSHEGTSKGVRESVRAVTRRDAAVLVAAGSDFQRSRGGR